MSHPAPIGRIRHTDETALGEGQDSKSISSESEVSLEHYYLPVSRQWARPDIRFYTLKVEWENDTAHLSSVTEMAMHPAYQQIIGMGVIALPYIFTEIRKKPDHWFWALKSITGEDPVTPGQRGKIKEMTECWLRWAKDQGY
jgi:hypothetical protein